MLKDLHGVMCTPGLWLGYARLMKQAADILFSRSKTRTNVHQTPRADLAIPATLLYGYAIENAIKALVIKHNPITSGAEFTEYKNKSGWTNHKPVMLLESIKFGLDDDERNLLRVLSSFVIWAGKYPTSFGEIDLVISNQTTGKTSLIAAHALDERGRIEFNQLFERILMGKKR